MNSLKLFVHILLVMFALFGSAKALAAYCWDPYTQVYYVCQSYDNPIDSSYYYSYPKSQVYFNFNNIPVRENNQEFQTGPVGIGGHRR